MNNASEGNNRSGRDRTGRQRYSDVLPSARSQEPPVDVDSDEDRGSTWGPVRTFERTQLEVGGNDANGEEFDDEDYDDEDEDEDASQDYTPSDDSFREDDGDHVYGSSRMRAGSESPDDNSPTRRSLAFLRQLVGGGPGSLRRGSRSRRPPELPLPPPLPPQDLSCSQIAADIERATRPVALCAPIPLCKCQSRSKERVHNMVDMVAKRQTEGLGTCHFTAGQKAHCYADTVFTMEARREVDRRFSRVYVGRFSASGNVFVAAFQHDKKVCIYEADNDWRLRKEVFARNLRWTVTDTDISPDERFLVYSSITPEVMLVNLAASGVSSEANVTDIHQELLFDPTPGQSQNDNYHRRHGNYGIWSVKWSADGRELVAGAGDASLYLYDVAADRVALCFKGHDDDVNAVAWADDTGHVVLSGSDDTICQMWDRRTPGIVRGRPVGSFVGHLEGITHIDAKGDGRHFISNAKDQTIKLWDMRKCVSNKAMAEGAARQGGLPSFEWDYRWMQYPQERRRLYHPNDISIMTYRGHAILQTLIRAYFSPVATTGQRYIYGGSACGAVFVWDVVSGKVIHVLKHHEEIVRDVSWHPSQPTIVTTSFDGSVVQWDCRHVSNRALEEEELNCEPITSAYQKPAKRQQRSCRFGRPGRI